MRTNNNKKTTNKNSIKLQFNPIRIQCFDKFVIIFMIVVALFLYYKITRSYDDNYRNDKNLFEHLKSAYSFIMCGIENSNRISQCFSCCLRKTKNKSSKEDFG